MGSQTRWNNKMIKMHDVVDFISRFKNKFFNSESKRSYLTMLCHERLSKPLGKKL